MDLFEVLNGVWNGLFTNVIAEPAIFIGLIVLLGYALLRRPWYECFSGFIKASVGFFILIVGSGGLVNTFRPVLAGLADRFQLKAAVIDPYFGWNAVTQAFNKAGWTTSYIMMALLIAFLWNITLVAFRRYTKVRTLFITGHVMIQQANTSLWMIFIGVPLMQNNIWGIVACGLLLGTYWAVFSNLTVECTQELTGGAGFAVGHQQMGAVWLTSKIAPKIGNRDRSVEHLELPGFFKIFNDNVVAASTLMLIFFGAILYVLGPDYLASKNAFNPASGELFIKYVFKTSVHFAVYLYILQSGVRMFVAELTQSFQGISDTLLKGGLPAIDCAATYGFDAAGGNSVLFGFTMGAIGQFVAIAGLLVFHSPIMIITGFVPVFFDNATLGVFANRFGGVRALVIICFLCGVLQVLGGAVAAGLTGLYEFGGYHGNIDWDTIWTLNAWLFQAFGVYAIAALIVLMLLIPQFQYRRNKAHYFIDAEVGAAE
ncbi:MAG TPA: PTS ascorbate transporter subunit IIC [Telmatospirillum sp.]|nr:PTS ascorbate transporter subunit IIC [Telmatospirillum sp.]